MISRSTLIDNFLTSAGWQGARRNALAGDASFRRYERIYMDGKQAVLMDAPPGKEDVRLFVQVAEHLHRFNYSAPKILAQDIANGFLLLEDLGDSIFTKVLHTNPEKEEELYLRAADVLVDIYHQAPKADYVDFAPYDETLYMRECTLFGEWFLPMVVPEEQAKIHAGYYKAIWQGILPKLQGIRSVLVMRDYHADNLLWLGERAGLKRVGLLDFQDAVIGSPAYDMVSFLEDARRDVTSKTVQNLISHYIQNTGVSKDNFMTAYAILGAQRNCKIIGIFARLAVRDNKKNYLSYLPRVWKHLEQDLQHPDLKPLRNWMDRIIKPEWRTEKIAL
jgi:aminoglycoside/choline kinase family phosphotransferase